jgi:hypothetical protein
MPDQLRDVLATMPDAQHRTIEEIFRAVCAPRGCEASISDERRAMMQRCRWRDLSSLFEEQRGAAFQGAGGLMCDAVRRSL